MKKFILFVLLFSAVLDAYPQCFNTVSEFNTNQLYFYESVRDPYGNTYATGSFRGAVTIGHLNFDGTANNQNLLVIKFDKNNEPVWGFTTGGDGGVHGKRIELDANNDIIIGGSFSASSLEFGCYTLSNTGHSNLFVCKLTKAGDVVWAVGSNGPREKYTSGLAVAPDNSIILTGNFVGVSEVAFGNISTHGIGGYDMFIAKFSGAGEPIWIRSFGGTNSYDYVHEVNINAQGESFITGNFTGESIDFDGTVFEPGNPSENYFLAKLDRDGQVEWAKTTDQNCVASGFDLTLDEQGNIYTTGRYRSTIVIEGESVSSVGEADIFLLKYDDTGANQWLKSLGGSSFDTGYKLASGHGELSLSAFYYSSDFYIGSTEITNNSGFANAFIADFDPDGQFGCVTTYDIDYEIYINDLKYDSLNNITVVKEINYLTSTVLEWRTNNTNWIEEPNYDLSLDLGEDLLLCEGENKVLRVEVPCDGSIEWQDGSIYDSMLVDHAGTYWVKVTKGSDTVADTILVSYYDHFEPLIRLDTMVCAGTDIPVDVADPLAEAYHWSTGQSGPAITIDQAGEFWVERQNQCYQVRDTFHVAYNPSIYLELGKDTVMCASPEAFVLSAADSGATSYLWSTGETTPEIAVTSTGLYSVQVSNGCEVTSDSIKVAYIPAEVQYLPNIITPNGDALNDTFQVPKSMQPSKILITNRWGKQVYHNDQYDNTWQADGLSEGLYFYQIKGGKCADNTFNGVIHVMR